MTYSGKTTLHAELRTDQHIYNKGFPKFGVPKVIGYIGLENLKYARKVCEQEVKFDLNVLYEESKHKPEDLDVKITELLKFLLQHKTRLNFPIKNSLDSAKFFCYRGLMTLVACTPYENREPWKIVAILYKGSIYLCARDTDEKIKKKLSMTEKDKLFTSWGYKFEQYMLSDTPDSEPNPNVPVDETEEFSLVFQTNLNRHTIVYGAEMDGIRCDKGQVSKPPSEELGLETVVEYLSTKKFIELKTNRHMEFPQQLTSFRRFKTKKWWCQSYFVGVEDILCGFRNDDGIVEELKLFRLKDLAGMSQRFWTPNVCLNFLDDFFTFVKRSLARQIAHKLGPKALDNFQLLPLTALLFEWTPGMPVQVSDTYIHEDDPILLPWFIDGYSDRCEVIKISQPIKSHWAKERNLNLNELMSDSEYKEQHRLDMIRWSEEMREQDYGYFCRDACQNGMLFYELAADKPIWIVSDIRRKTDIRWFRETYTNLIRTIRISADEATRKSRGYKFIPGIDDITSECDLDDINEWDLMIDNGANKQQLEEQLGSILGLLSHL